MKALWSSGEHRGLMVWAMILGREFDSRVHLKTRWIRCTTWWQKKTTIIIQTAKRGKSHQKKYLKNIWILHTSIFLDEENAMFNAILPVKMSRKKFISFIFSFLVLFFQKEVLSKWPSEVNHVTLFIKKPPCKNNQFRVGSSNSTKTHFFPEEYKSSWFIWIYHTSNFAVKCKRWDTLSFICRIDYSFKIVTKPSN
jgi:hypothetical protein